MSERDDDASDNPAVLPDDRAATSRFSQFTDDSGWSFGETPRTDTQTSATGSFLTHAGLGAAPAAGSLAAAGLGAEVGTAILPGWGTAAGAIIGGLGGGYALSTAQHWALSKLPDSWRDALDISDEKLQQQEREHTAPRIWAVLFRISSLCSLIG
jgi:hypothetical protein